MSDIITTRDPIIIGWQASGHQPPATESRLADQLWKLRAQKVDEITDRFERGEINVFHYYEYLEGLRKYQDVAVELAYSLTHGDVDSDEHYTLLCKAQGLIEEG